MPFSEVSLLQIPETPMKNISEYLDFPSILVLRKVCHDLRKFIDDTETASRLTCIRVDVNPESINFNLFLPRSPLPISIEYVKNGEGCLVKCEKEENVKEKILENEDFVTLLCQDFDIVLGHQKTVLDQFSIYFNFSELSVKERVLEFVNKSLKSLNHYLQVKLLFMGMNNPNDIMFILPYIDSISLEKFSIYCSLSTHNVLNLDEIGQLEQWKHAERLWIRGFQLTDAARNLKHFSRIYLGFREIPIEDLILLKEIFLSSSTINIIKIFNNDCSIDVVNQKLIESFGLDHLRDEKWFFRIPDTYQFLKITQQYFDIHFDRIEQSDVPLNAKILN